MDQEEIADRVEISPRYVGSIERARVSVTLKILGRLAKAFSVTPADLLNEF